MKTLAKLLMTVSVIFLAINSSDAKVMDFYGQEGSSPDQISLINKTLVPQQKKPKKKKRVVSKQRENKTFLSKNPDFDLSTTKIRRNFKKNGANSTGVIRKASISKRTVRRPFNKMNGRGTEDQSVKKTSSRKIRDHRTVNYVKRPDLRESMNHKISWNRRKIVRKKKPR